MSDQLVEGFATRLCQGDNCNAIIEPDGDDWRDDNGFIQAGNPSMPFHYHAPYSDDKTYSSHKFSSELAEILHDMSLSSFQDDDLKIGTTSYLRFGIASAIMTSDDRGFVYAETFDDLDSAWSDLQVAAHVEDPNDDEYEGCGNPHCEHWGC